MRRKSDFQLPREESGSMSLSPEHPATGPTILHVMYDSLRSVEKSVAELAAEQSNAAVMAERVRGDIAVIRHSMQGFATLHKDVSDLKRKMWLISLAGGLAAGVATIVFGSWLSDTLDRPRDPAYSTPEHPRSDRP
jgi:hypothetical protein